MYRELLIAGALLLPAGAVLGAPSISSVSGTIADDQTVTISGSGFGSNSLRNEWLGGATGAIESGAVGASWETLRRPGWNEDLSPAVFDSKNVYSGHRSLIFDSGAPGNDGRFGMDYDTGSTFPELYTSYMTYLDDKGVTLGQWKMMRWCYTNSVMDTSTPDTYFSNWTGGPGDMITILNGTVSTPDEDRSMFMDPPVLPPSMGWYRVEAYMRPSSTDGASDGELWIRTTRAADGKQVGYARYTNQRFYNTGESKRYRYVIFQNYQGNGFGNLGSTGTVVWMDDVYISQTQARVEICNAATWSACTKKDIQPPSSWSDARITVKLNQGGQSLAGAYLYVIDGTGAVNTNGYPLSGTPPKVPQPPTNVTAQ